MKKKVLSEIDIHEGFVDMPKYFEINRPELKSDILESYINKKSLSDNSLDYAIADYEVPYSRAFDMLQKYITEYFYLRNNKKLVLLKSFGTVLGFGEQSFSRNLIDPLNLRESPDYVMIYGVDVQPKSSNLVIEYNDNRRANQISYIPLNNNCFVIFPSTQKFFITANPFEKQNIFLTSTFEYI